MMSCEKLDKTCKYDNPLEDLQWLKDLKSSLTNCGCEISIFQATYNKETVFYDAITDPRCNSIFNITLRNCSGDTIKTYDYSLLENFNTEVTDRKGLYSCKTEK